MQAVILPPNVVEILKVGLAGLCFLLSLLAFRLIHREQQRQGAARKLILRAIYVFMASNLVAAILVALASYFAPRQETSSQVAPPTLEQIEVVRARIYDLVGTKTGLLDQLLRDAQLSDYQKQRIKDTVTQLKEIDVRLEKAARGESSTR